MGYQGRSKTPAALPRTPDPYVIFPITYARMQAAAPTGNLCLFACKLVLDVSAVYRSSQKSWP